MRTKFTYLKIVFGAVFLILIFLPSVQAQDRVNINQADQAEGVTIDGETVRKILGNVILTTDEMVLETDSVYHYTDRNLLTAYNIEIETEDEMIWADTLYHDTETEISRLRGRVIVRSDQNIMFSDSIDVDMETDHLLLEMEFIIRKQTVLFFAEMSNWPIQLNTSNQIHSL